MLAVAAVFALGGFGSAASAAPIDFEISGLCQGGCNAGNWIDGIATFDRSAGRIPPLDSSNFTGFAFSVDQGPLQTATNLFATGFWDSGKGNAIDQIDFNTGSAVSPAVGWSTTASLARQLDGTLSGILIFNLGGACATASCEQIHATLTQSHFEVVMTPVPGPTPVPLPPALGLAFVGAGALAGVSRLRRGRRAA